MAKGGGLRRAKGNMYGWVTHVWNPVYGRCKYGCPYCYVQAMAGRFEALARRYKGPYRLADDVGEVQFGRGRVVFVGHMTDLFCDEVPSVFVGRVVMLCRGACPSNKFVFQTRNTERVVAWVYCLPAQVAVGTTIETDVLGVGNGPVPRERAAGLRRLKGLRPDIETFVTVEPMLESDLGALVELISEARPDWVNVGLDSKAGEFCSRHGASREQAVSLVKRLERLGVEVRVKGRLATQTQMALRVR